VTAGFVDYVGGGLFLAFSAVYFTSVVGLSTALVGVGLGIAGCVALAAATPVGMVADRVGVRRTLVVLHLCRAIGTLGYALVTGWWGALAAMIVVTVADQSVTALTQAFVAELADGERRTRVLATYRTAVNVAISIGSPLGGLVAGLHRVSAFRGVLLIAASAYVLVSILIARIPQGRRVPVPRRRLAALHDRRLRRLASIDTLLQLWTPVLNLGFPLWLATRTDAGRGWIGPLYAIATALCVVLQLPVTRLARTVPAARTAQIAAGLLLALSCAAFAAAARTHGSATIVVFALAVVLLTGGEMLAVAAAWTLSYAIAPAERRAEYLSAFAMGRSTARYVLGPILVTGLLTVVGGWTWPVLAGMFTLAAAATPWAYPRTANAVRHDDEPRF
jgi:MFS family permease